MGGRSPSRRGRRGQILIMALLAMTLMIGLIFYVYNVGDHANRRLALQSAADAAAISGADWIARSMNLVAMNNCTEARMLALVPVFDSAPLASAIAAQEMIAWEKGVAGQLSRGIPGDLGFLREGMEDLHDRYKRQRAILETFRDAVNLPAFDMSRTTFWQGSQGGPSPSGDLWRTAAGLQEFSDVTLDSAGVLAQSNAVRFGLANSGDVSFMLPVIPSISAKKGQF
ncbi:MAG: pilus assembly protein TadG-related protein, partial [Planctomycetota bacterium]